MDLSFVYSNPVVLIVLLASLVLSALVTVLVKNLLKAAIALAVTSAVLAVVMFFLGAPVAAVFELSVCAGLITVIFISAISLIKPKSPEEIKAESKGRINKFIFLPILLAGAGVALIFALGVTPASLAVTPPPVPDFEALKTTIWNTRQIDMVGQIVIILAGVIGVAVLFKGAK